MIKYYDDLIQGSDEWYAARCGLLTASEMKLILTPTLKIAANDKQRSHVSEIAAQRISKYVEPSYISSDMIRGQEDEVEAKILYNEKYEKTQDVGFVTNDKWGFTIGYSPDAVVGDDGLIECKSRCQKYQIETIATLTVPEEYMLQLQTALLVTERKWIDFISYSAGLPMFTIRVAADDSMQQSIIAAATDFEEKVSVKTLSYHASLLMYPRLIPTVRKPREEIVI